MWEHVHFDGNPAQGCLLAGASTVVEEGGACTSFHCIPGFPSPTGVSPQRADVASAQRDADTVFRSKVAGHTCGTGCTAWTEAQVVGR